MRGVLTFGRFNPPTIGHEKLLDTMFSIDSDIHYVAISRTQDPMDNPLAIGEKLSIMREMYPEHSMCFHQACDDSPDILSHATIMNNSGVRNLIVVVGGDRVDTFNTLLHKYNEDLYTFESIEVISSGDRNTASSDITEAISATKVREFARNDNFNDFIKGLSSRISVPIAREIMCNIKTRYMARHT